LARAAENDALAIEVEQLSGRAVQGVLSGIAKDRIELLVNGKPNTMSADALPIVKFRQPRGSHAETLRQASWGAIATSDGSAFPIEAIVLSPSGDEFLVRLPTDCLAGPARRLSILADRTQSVRLPPVLDRAATSAKGKSLQKSLLAQWRKLRELPATDDRLVTTSRDGKTLKYIDGFIEAMDAQRVTLLLSDEPLEIPLKKIYGIIIGQPDDAPPAAVEAELAGPLVSAWPDVRLAARSLQLDLPSQLQVETYAGLKLTLPLSNIKSIDYTAGKIAHLSELRPESSQLRPLFGLPQGISGDKPLRAMRSDQSYWGGDLSLSADDLSERRTFARGLAIRSGAEITYTLGGQYRRLQGTASLAPTVSGPRSLHLIVEGDSQTLLEATITQQSKPLAIDVNCEGVERLRLRLQRVKSLDATLHLGDARLLR